MRIDEFGMAIADEVRLNLGSEYKIEYKEVSKNNGVIYHALLIKKEGENVSPTIYIDGFYEKYKKGAEKSSITGEILSLYREYAPKERIDVSFFTDFSNVCSHLTFKVANYEKNKKSLSDTPYKRIENLALVPICLVSDEVFGEGNIVIKNEHLRVWEISFEELWENTWENAPRIAPVKRKNLFEVVGKTMGDELFSYEDLPQNMFVITNLQETFGASAVFYQGYLEELADEIGSDLVVIPSSVHETIVMCAPDDTSSLGGLTSMVKEVNSTVLTSEDYLSDSVYLYSREKKKLTAIQE
jgi:hypothetical protein